MEERCDQIMDCVDQSDENNCKLIEFNENYNKKVPPFTINKEDKILVPAKIKVSTQLKNVLAISEFSHTIDLKIGITLKWYENRVLYHNLKTQEALNVLILTGNRHIFYQIFLSNLRQFPGLASG